MKTEKFAFAWVGFATVCITRGKSYHFCAVSAQKWYLFRA